MVLFGFTVCFCILLKCKKKSPTTFVIEDKIATFLAMTEWNFKKLKPKFRWLSNFRLSCTSFLVFVHWPHFVLLQYRYD